MKNKVNRETAIEYVYEYGWEKASKIFNISEQELDNIVNDVRSDWKKPHINVNARIDYINPKISEFINKHYSELYQKYVKNKDYNILYQNDEDILHTSLIKLCSELSNPSDAEINKKFDKIFKDSKLRYIMNNKQMNRKETNKIELVDEDETNE